MAVHKRSKEPITLGDFSLTGISRESPVLVGAKQPGTDLLIVAAIGRLDVITTPGTFNRKHNNVYWSTSADFFSFTSSPFEFNDIDTLVKRLRECSTWQLWSRHDNFERIIMIPTGPIVICDE